MRAIEQICHLARDTFDRHEVTRRIEFPIGEGETWQNTIRHFRFQRPGTWIYGFDVSFLPGLVILHGDIGHLTLSRSADMWDWTWRNVGNRDDPRRIDFQYVAEKAPPELQTREFDEQAAHEQLDNMLGDDEDPIFDYEQRLELHSFLDDGVEGLREVNERLYQETGEMISGEDYSPRFVWCILGLRAFMRAVVTPAAVAAE